MAIRKDEMPSGWVKNPNPLRPQSGDDQEPPEENDPPNQFCGSARCQRGFVNANAEPKGKICNVILKWNRF